MSVLAVTGTSGSLGQFIKGKILEINRSNLTNVTILEDVLRTNKVETMLHLASPTQTLDSPAIASDYKTDIHKLTMSLFEKFAIAGGKKFGYVSTAHVYGSQDSPRPITESDKCHPITDYAKWKLETEEDLLIQGRKYGIQVVVFRPFSVFGSGMRSHFLAGRLEQESKRGKFTPIKFSLDWRDFSTPQQMAEKIGLIMHSPWQALHSVLNICSGESETVKERVLKEYPNFPKELFRLKYSFMPFLLGDPSAFRDFLGKSDNV